MSKIVTILLLMLPIWILGQNAVSTYSKRLSDASYEISMHNYDAAKKIAHSILKSIDKNDYFYQARTHDILYKAYQPSSPKESLEHLVIATELIDNCMTQKECQFLLELYIDLSWEYFKIKDLEKVSEIIPKFENVIFSNKLEKEYAYRKLEDYISLVAFDMASYGGTIQLEEQILAIVERATFFSKEIKRRIYADLSTYIENTDKIRAVEYLEKAAKEIEDESDESLSMLSAYDYKIFLFMTNNGSSKHSIDFVNYLKKSLDNLNKIRIKTFSDSLHLVDLHEYIATVYLSARDNLVYLESARAHAKDMIDTYPNNSLKGASYYTKLIYAYSILGICNEVLAKSELPILAAKGLQLCEEAEISNMQFEDQDWKFINTMKIRFIGYIDPIKELYLLDNNKDSISAQIDLISLFKRASTLQQKGLNDQARDLYVSALNSLLLKEDKIQGDSILIIGAAQEAFYLSVPDKKKLEFGELALNYIENVYSLPSSFVSRQKCRLLLDVGEGYFNILSDEDKFQDYLGKAYLIIDEHGYTDLKCDALLKESLYLNYKVYTLELMKALDEVGLILKNSEELKNKYFDDLHMIYSTFYSSNGEHSTAIRHLKRIEEYYDLANIGDITQKWKNRFALAGSYGLIDVDSSLYYFQEAEKLLSHNLQNYDLSFFLTHSTKALLFGQKGEPMKAIASLTRAIDYVDSKKNARVDQKLVLSSRMNLYGLRVEYTPLEVEEISKVEKTILKEEPDISLIVENSLLQVYLNFLSKWADFNQYVDVDRTFQKVEQSLRIVTNRINDRTIEMNNFIAISISSLFNSYLSLNNLGQFVEYDELLENSKYWERFFDNNITEEVKRDLFLKHFHYLLGLNASKIKDPNFRNTSVLNHMSRAYVIRTDYFKYKSRLEYIYANELFYKGRTRNDSADVNLAIQLLEESIFSLSNNIEIDHSIEMINKLKLLSYFYLVTETIPKPMFFSKFIEAQDIYAFSQGINEKRLRAIRYFQQSEQKNRSSESQMYYLNFNLENNLIAPSEEPIATLLPSQGALISIYKTRHNDKNLYAAIIYRKDGKSNLVNLGEADLLEVEHIEIIDNYRFNEIYNNYWSKLEPYLDNIEHLYLIAEGVYKRINPMALENNKGEFLVDNYNINILSSILDLYFEGFSFPVQSNETILIGNPAFTSSSSSVSQRGAIEFVKKNRGGSDNNKWVSLPGTMIEIDEIKSALSAYNYNVTSASGQKAEESFIRSVSNPEILHIATHGFVDPDKSEYSNGLVFAGANDATSIDLNSENDGYFYAENIDNMNLMGTKLVVLSACETGLSSENKLDFRKAFFNAGTENLMVSLWSIDDEATKDLMSMFYKNLVQTSKINYSFHLAQDYMKEKYKDPYYWGSFILISTSADTQLK